MASTKKSKMLPTSVLKGKPPPILQREIDTTLGRPLTAGDDSTRKRSPQEAEDDEEEQLGELAEGDYNYLDVEEDEEEGDDDDPCFGFDDFDEEEDEEEEEEEVPELIDHRQSSDDELGAAKQQKKFRRHHFIKHEICIPDHNRRNRKVIKGRPWWIKVKSELEKRQDSKIVFNMPKQEDPEVLALRRTNKMVQKLIKYMKKSWKVRIDRKQAERELEHRTLVSTYTKKPDDWLEKIRAREDRALETGFFSAMDIPYESLVDLELDTPMLTFKNLPPDLKITAGRWIRAKLRKEELKRKRDAFLPRVPHGKVQRPSYNKGRLIKDPGGASKVDQFAKVAEGFVKVTRGNKPYSKVLREWSEKREKENYNSNSGFGPVREGMFNFTKPRSKSAKSMRKTEVKQKDASANADQRRVSIVDARKYQRDMLYFEKMLGAMNDIVKSLLNIKMKQLESKFPLPPVAVNHIRGRSPDRHGKYKSTPMLVIQRQAKLQAKQSLVGFNSKRPSDEPENNPGHLAGVGRELSETSIAGGPGVRKSLADWNADRRASSVMDITRRLSRVVAEGKVETANIQQLLPEVPRSSKALVDNIKTQHAFEDMMEMKARKQKMLTAEQKIKRLAENPDHAAIRRARNYMTYTKLFERNRKPKPPVWHNIDVTAIATVFSEKGLAGKDASNLTEADAAEVVEAAMKKRKSMKRNYLESDDEATRRWPAEFDIPTPTFQFPASEVKIPSEEQSRLNLLKKTPHMDEVPSTPVRRLFKLAGVRTVERDIFTNIMEMKKTFRLTENKVRIYYENEVGKLDWDTIIRFRGKLAGIKSAPTYFSTISNMRRQHEEGLARKDKEDDDDPNAESEEDFHSKMKQKRPALWFRKLQEICDQNGASRHNGCQTELQKLMGYCDVDMKTKPHMLNRLALLVVSLPTTELGTEHWQHAVVFLLEHMCGTPTQMMQVWLKYRNIPYLL